ncbi:MAG: dihydropteroate synthase [Planctomycetes bacterium]|nr:dihydropteroate synthase [Planctomycetota bacterium]
MKLSRFIAIGENIHCTRIVKRGGKSAVQLPDGREVIRFTYKGEDRELPIPTNWGGISPAFNDGKVKHVAVAIWQATEGDAPDAAADYLCSVAGSQIDGGASFLDVNVDEYTNDPARRTETMTWLASFLSERFDTPLSIDSSDAGVIAAGLKACRAETGPHMVNSASLERPDCIAAAAEYGANVVTSAAGADTMPSTSEERLANLARIIGLLDEAGVAREKLFLDPLVFPLSTDPNHGKNFLETTRRAKARFEGAHLCGGLSNVSFGMPQRKLLNMVFTWLCVEAGTDSGIIDPATMPISAVEALDPQSEPFQLARAFLLGEDMYGMEFIAAHRAGKLD